MNTATFFSSSLSNPRSGIGVLSLLMACTGHAADAPPFADLLRQSLSLAPLMVAQAANVRAASADAAQSRAWLNPRIDTLIENIGAPSADGNSQRQNTYMVSQPLEIGGKRDARIAAGDRSVTLARARERQIHVAYAAELAVVHATAEAMLARKALASENLRHANEELSAARALVLAGREATLRVTQAQASVSAAHAAEVAAGNDIVQALSRLSAMTGASERYTALSSSLLSLKPSIPAEGMGAEDAPAVLTAAAERDALEARVEVERKRWIPEVSINAGVRSYGWTNDNGYVIGVTASIPLFDRNRYGVDAAAERAAAASALLDSARLEATAARQSALSLFSATEQQLAAASTGEAAASEAYRLSRIGYDAGRTSLIELLAVRRALVEARQLAIDAQLARTRAAAAIAQTSGRLAFEEAR